MLVVEDSSMLSRSAFLRPSTSYFLISLLLKAVFTAQFGSSSGLVSVPSACAFLYLPTQFLLHLWRW